MTYVEPATQDLTGLQNWVTSLKSSGGVPWLTDGVYTFSTTWTIQQFSGFGIGGSGRRPYIWNMLSSDKSLNGGPILHYTGPGNQPAILIESCMDLKFPAFGLLCDNAMTAGAIQFKNSYGYGNSGHCFDRVAMYAPGGIGFKFGEILADQPNCSDMSFYAPFMVGFDQFFMTCGGQQLNYDIYSPSCNQGGSLLYALRGGSFRIFGGGTYGLDWLLTAGAGGVNIGATLIRGLRTDGGGKSKANTGWVNLTSGFGGDTVGNALTNVLLDGVSEVGINHAAASGYPPLIQTGPNSQVRTYLNGVQRSSPLASPGSNIIALTNSLSYFPK